MMKLTARQQQVMDVIKASIDSTGMPPTRADIARTLGFKSANAAEEHLKALAKKGVIELVAGTSRGIRLTEQTGIPIVGRVAAGAPLLAQEHIEDCVSTQIFGTNILYALPTGAYALIMYITGFIFIYILRRSN